MAKNESFSDIELANMDTLIRRLQAVDKSAQSMNIKLQRIIDQNEVAITPEPRKSLENPAVSKSEPKDAQQTSATKSVEPVNVGKDEDLFFSEPLIEPLAPVEEDKDKAESLPVIPNPVEEKSIDVEPIQSEKNIETKQLEEKKSTPQVINNIENTNIIATEPEVLEEENIVKETPPVEPVAANLPVQETKIIEKPIPVVNTVEKLKEPVLNTPELMPEIKENKPQTSTVSKINSDLIEQEKTPEAPATFNIVNEPPEQPAVNVNVEPPLSPYPLEKNIVERPQAEAKPSTIPTLATEPEIVENIISEPIPASIPDMAEQPTPEPINVLANESEAKKEIPPVITEPEVLKPEEGLNLADQNLVEINKNIGSLTEVFKQGQAKLATSVDSLNRSVSEILKLLPTLQTGSQQTDRPPRNAREEKIDAANLISTYRQNLGLATRSYTQNTVFPGGNSIA